MATKTWSALWGNWQVVLRQLEVGRWSVRVFRWSPERKQSERRVLATCDYFARRENAVTWAADVMRHDGAKVFVLDAPGLSLEAMLRFTPAPELAA
jgi:hypothetical protein